MKNFTGSLAAVVLLLVGCGAPPVGSDGSDTSAEEALSSQALSAFTLQYAGLYAGSDTSRAALKSISLRPDGTYVALWVDGTREKGHFSGGTAKVDPLPLTLHAGPHAWTASVQALAGKITVGTQVLLVHGGVQSEAACDATHGRWTDDDPDPTSGLFCICPSPDVLVWSAGGCVTERGKTTR